ncbi:hypothetical protein BU26DRAFT_319175 [Trematosphaeria pertusa]|uniref:Uncharacterized protein n=1 Tax=Trematosphaeria pertusa TaxID=390896 RepID=A0A6A6IH40_9PLEO|nr:uncharacterized protein BU26DRAFT_319175 [Trematosphaeria pertusa]KAF2249529.1 hypothetical protein BU26DRAFT_319175 [Trematosphaeria pertusa]
MASSPGSDPSTPTARNEKAVSRHTRPLDATSQMMPAVQINAPDELDQLFNRLKHDDVRHIRLRILAPLSCTNSAAELTEEEVNGGVEWSSGSNVAPLVEAWRNQFSKLPDGHCLERIDFDMSCPGRHIELRHIGRLLAYIQIFTGKRGRGNVRCVITGAGEDEVQRLRERWLGPDVGEAVQ